MIVGPDNLPLGRPFNEALPIKRTKVVRSSGFLRILHVDFTIHGVFFYFYFPELRWVSTNRPPVQMNDRWSTIGIE